MMCRLCSHNISNITRLGVPLSNLTADDYCITDMRFGTHLSIYDCPECGLRQCESSLDLDKFYINLVDDDYERDRSTRYKQMLDLLNFLDSPSVDNKEGAKLLDVGAGSCILIEAA
jgi:hypothetical protein